MKRLLIRRNNLIFSVVFILVLSSFSIIFADNGEDMPIRRSIPTEINMSWLYQKLDYL